MINRLVAMNYIFLLEFIFVGLFLFLFIFSFDGTVLPPFLILFILAFSGFNLFILLLEKSGNNGKLYYLFTVFPLLLILGTSLGFSFISVIMIGILVFWRGISIHSNHSTHNNAGFLFFSFMIGIWDIMYAGFRQYPYLNVIIGMLILQLILVLSGLYFSKWDAIKENRKKFILFYGGFLGATAVLGMIITYSLHLVQTIFFGLATLLIKLSSYLLIPLQYVGVLFLRIFGHERRDVEVKNTAPPQEAKLQLNEAAGSSPYAWLTILLIAAALFAYYIYKNRRIILSKYETALSVELSEEITLEEERFLSKKRAKPPKDLIRSEIFYLEKYAQKKKLGRRPFESLTDWWDRIGITSGGELLKKYENVRYGEYPSTPDDLVKVKAEIEQIKQQLKCY